MHILVIGAAGMVGRKLTDRLVHDGRLGKRDISKLTLQDVVAPAKPNTPIPVDIVISDFADPKTAGPLVAGRPDVIFHLAAIVSGEAEADFDKGYRINLDGTRYLIDAIHNVCGGYKPRLVFTSSIAVFGAPFPDRIGDDFLSAPLTSYGTQKAVVARIRHEPEQTIIGIVSGWPRNFDTARARKLGFTTTEKTFDDIIRIHIEDELGGRFVN